MSASSPAVGQRWLRDRDGHEVAITGILDNHRGDVLEIAYRRVQEDGALVGSTSRSMPHTFTRRFTLADKETRDGSAG
jgi:hypothetical protein